jgi:hypothetical protein
MIKCVLAIGMGMLALIAFYGYAAYQVIAAATRIYQP